MAGDAETFAAFAGMEVEAFRKFMGEDLIEAFIRVLDHIGKTTHGIESLAATLELWVMYEA